MCGDQNRWVFSRSESAKWARRGRTRHDGASRTHPNPPPQWRHGQDPWSLAPMKPSPSNPVCAARSSRTGRPCQKAKPRKGRPHGRSRPHGRTKPHAGTRPHAAAHRRRTAAPASSVRPAAAGEKVKEKLVLPQAGDTLPIRPSYHRYLRAHVNCVDQGKAPSLVNLGKELGISPAVLPAAQAPGAAARTPIPVVTV